MPFLEDCNLNLNHRNKVDRGTKLAMALAGSWRHETTVADLDANEWARIADSLLHAGQGALAWRRMRHGPARFSPSARRFCDAYRQQTLHAGVQERAFERIFNILAEAGVAPLMIKGWDSARSYAEPGLRPYGATFIDLCVQPGQLDNIQAILNRYPKLGSIDLHEGVPDLPDRTWDQLWQRAQVVPFGAATVRVLGPEDHLRLIALHLVRHGASRPLWLCDVAAALEAQPTSFDWNYCLSGDPQLSSWLLTVIGLAGRLLGADVSHLPPGMRAQNLPAWLVTSVLWRRRGPGPTGSNHIHYYMRHPLGAVDGLFHDGFNPIKATFRLGVRPHGLLPLLAIQLAHGFLARMCIVPPKASNIPSRKLQGAPPRNYDVHQTQRF